MWTDIRHFQSFKSKFIIRLSKITRFPWYLTRYITRNVFEVMVTNIAHFLNQQQISQIGKTKKQKLFAFKLCQGGWFQYNYSLMNRAFPPPPPNKKKTNNLRQSCHLIFLQTIGMKLNFFKLFLFLPHDKVFKSLSVCLFGFVFSLWFPIIAVYAILKIIANFAWFLRLLVRPTDDLIYWFFSITVYAKAKWFNLLNSK